MKKLLLASLFSVFLVAAYAQKTPAPKLSGMYVGMSFDRFASSIEADSPYRFFFKEADLEGILVNIQLTNSELKNALDQIFANTGLYYSIDKSNQVWITRGRKITLDFPSDYFQLQERNDVAAGTSDSLEAFAKNKRFVIGKASANPQSKTATLSGIVSSIESGQPINGAIVLEKVNYSQIVTDASGSYRLTLPKGRHTIVVQNIGGFQEQRQIDLQGDGTLDMRIEENVLSLDEFVVSSGALSNINKLEMGVQSISIAEVKRLPAILGEVDVIRGLLTMPGVNTVGEASVGFNVRGGAADQNLILYNQSTVFNPSHVFGFFSAFNPDMVSGVELYKGSVPVNYGGRLSSVLQVAPKFGSSEKIGVSGGIGIMTGRLSVEGPIGDKTTFIVGGRSTYSNWALNLLDDEAALNGSQASFYDFNANIKHQVNAKNSLEFTSYLSRDEFSFDPDTTYSYQNQNLALTWRPFSMISSRENSPRAMTVMNLESSDRIIP